MTNPLDQFIKRGLEYSEKASDGPWCTRGPNSWLETPGVHLAYDDKPGGLVAHMTHYGKMREDARFIVQARTDLPLALKMLERAVEALRRARDRYDDPSEMHNQNGGWPRPEMAWAMARDIQEALSELSAMAEGASK